MLNIKEQRVKMGKKTGLSLIVAGILAIIFSVAWQITSLAAQATSEADGSIQGQTSLTATYLAYVFKSGNIRPADGFIAHQGRLLEYNGASTCVACHAEKVHQFSLSNHYLWAGKFGVINDFCGSVDINFSPIKLTNNLGALVDSGCATCHAGLGEAPSIDNPLNADCLVCHAEDYRRIAVLADNEWRFVPDLDNMPEMIAIQGEPTRYACLTCHAYSGDGSNNKRGDLSDALIEPTAGVDVHMGNGMQCTDCHLTEDHRIAGRGVDLRIDEGVAMRPCTDCHTPETDHIPEVQMHLAKVACETCHIAEFARNATTDMFRDYRAVEVNARGFYEAAITRGMNVMPVYAFWNGESGFYQIGDPAVAGQRMAWPQGDIMDGMLYPFKLHSAMLPQDVATGALIPIRSSILFETGDMDQAIRAGAADAGYDLTQGYTFVEARRWMGLFHEIPPAEQVLSCAECHDTTERMDFSALGYDPVETRNGEPLCTSCHNRGPNLNFYEIHAQHVDLENIACAECHMFSR